MTKEELLKELDLMRDANVSEYALYENGYARGVSDATDAVNKYFDLAGVSGQLCGTCTDFKIVDKVFVCKKCGKMHKTLSA